MKTEAVTALAPGRRSDAKTTTSTQSFAQRYFAFIAHHKLEIIGAWLLIVVLGFAFGLKFLQHTTQDLNPSSNTASMQAHAALDSNFPALRDTSTLIVVATQSVASFDFPRVPALEDALTNLTSDITAWSEAHAVVSGDSMKQVVVKGSAQSFFTLQAQGFALLGSQLVANTGAHAQDSGSGAGAKPAENVTILSLAIDDDDDLFKQRNDFVTSLQRNISALNARDDVVAQHLSFAATGTNVFAADGLAKAIADLELLDGIVLPIAIIVLATIVRSARLIIIPVLCVAASFMAAFLVMYPVALHMAVITFTPPIMSSAIIALSIDYSLFLLSRFAEERSAPRHAPVEDAVRVMLQSAGHTVAVSGSTLTLCFLGICFLPLDLMQSLGLGAAVAVVATMASNLTLNPALILTFPGFFGGPPCCCRLLAWVPVFGGGGASGGLLQQAKSAALLDHRYSSSDSQLDQSPDARVGLLHDADEDGEDEGMSETLWYKLGKFVLALPPYNKWAPALVLVASLAFVIPFSTRAFDFTGSIELSLMLPRGCASADAFAAMQDSFGDGTVFPYRILLNRERSKGSQVWQQGFFDDAQGLVQGLTQQVHNTATQNFIGAVLLPYAVDAAMWVKLNSRLGNFASIIPECAVTKVGELATRSDAVVINAARNASWVQWAHNGSNCAVDLASKTFVEDYTEQLTALLWSFASDATGEPLFGQECIANLSTVLVQTASLIDHFSSNMTNAFHLLCDVTSTLANRYVTDTANMTYLDVRLDIDPSSPAGVAWLRDTRKYFDSHLGGNGQAQLQARLAGGATLAEDAVTAVYGVFPVMISVTLIVALVVVGGAFKSVFVPVRAIFTICLTLLWIYGLAVMVYVDGAWNGIGTPGLEANRRPKGQISWFAPIMCFSILVGLGLDYDIFLLTRILEYRDMGYSEKASVMLGLCKTGGIITAAGIIMAIAFSGLLFSSQMLLNQCAFYLVFAVLIDTFVVRTVLVPSIMGFAGTANWWPRKCPAPTKGLREFPSSDAISRPGVHGDMYVEDSSVVA